MSLKYLLDTNILSNLMRPTPSPLFMERVNLHRAEIATASIVIHELLYGCLRLPESRKRELFLNYIDRTVMNLAVFDYDLKAAKWHSEERVRLSNLGKTPAFADGQIASIAYCNNLISMTNNISDFQFFNNLKVENWFDSILINF